MYFYLTLITIVRMYVCMCVCMCVYTAGDSVRKNIPSSTTFEKRINAALALSKGKIHLNIPKNANASAVNSKYVNSKYVNYYYVCVCIYVCMYVCISYI